MRIKNTKLILLFILGLAITLNLYNPAVADDVRKTIVIVADNFDFGTIEKLNTDNEIAAGLMNAKTGSIYGLNSDESYYMTIASGRRVKVKGELFKGVKRNDNGKLVIEGYKDIILELDDKYPGFSEEIDILADTLKRNKVDVGYIGNDASALIAADKNGIINHGDNKIEYESNWLIDRTDDILNDADVLVVSYDIDENNERIQVLSDYINKYDMLNIIIFSKNISGDVNYRWNTTLVPMIYYTPNNAEGMLTSDSTRREGLVTNMDIFSELADIYDIQLNTNIGHEINSVSSSRVIEKNRNNLLEYLNLNIIKYVFHGLIIIIQFFVLFDILIRKRNNYFRYNILMNGIIITIFLSIILGIFNIHRNIILYCLVLIISSSALAVVFSKKGIKSIEMFSICTNIVIILGVYFKKNILYDSFIGYNNIVAGGRFYGLNNEAMGVLLITSIITFFALKRRIDNKIISLLILIVYYPIVIFALSGRYGANVGGYLTSIALFLMLIYTMLFNKKISKKNLLVLIGIGFGIFAFNLYFDFNSVSSSHAGSLVARIKILGYYELIDMFIKKVKQLLLMSIAPPWSIIFISQIYYIRRVFAHGEELLRKGRYEDSYMVKKLYIMFVISFVAFIINDTGVVAFVYMNTYLIAHLIGLHNIK